MGQAKQNNGGSFFRELVDWLASLRVTVYTLICLGIATLIGTVFPQLGVTLQVETLQEKLANPIWRAIHLLGFTDVFHSVWFLFLVALLMANLTACTVRSIGRTNRLVRGAPRVLDAEAEARIPVRRTEARARIDAGAVEKVLAAVGRIEREERAGVTYLFAQTRPLWRYGSVVVHLSIFFVLVGALLRLFAAQEGHMMIPEGGSSNLFGTEGGELRRVPFDVRCDRFSVEFYPGTERPKEYASALSVWQNGREAIKKVIQVNDPLAWEGFRFFQASYGKENFAVLTVGRDGTDFEMPVFFRQVHSVPGTREGLIVDQTRKGEAGGLEVHVTIRGAGGAHDGWVAMGAAPTAVGEYAVSFAGIQERFYTGLLVSADPSVPVLWAGFLLFFIGLFWTMGARPLRVWARVGADAVTVAASAKRKAAAEGWLERTMTQAKKG